MRVRPPESRARNPADSLPYSVVAAELETFLADQREREHEVALVCVSLWTLEPETGCSQNFKIDALLRSQDG
jgi:hypothetical protein